MIKDGGYCPRCDTIWAAPGKCKCDTISIEDKSKPVQWSVLHKEIWNSAIEAAALIVQPDPHVDEERKCEDIAETIRKLKK
jgi:hypothetical protein